MAKTEGARRWPVSISSSANGAGRFALAKVWLKDHEIKFEVKDHYCISSWQTIETELTVDQIGKLCLFLEKAEEFKKIEL